MPSVDIDASLLPAVQMFLQALQTAAGGGSLPAATPVSASTHITHLRAKDRRNADLMRAYNMLQNMEPHMTMYVNLQSIIEK